jgi:hypothetical protein
MIISPTTVADGSVTMPKLLGTDLTIGCGQFVPLDGASTVVQGTWVLQCITSAFHNMYIVNTSNASGDEIDFPVYLPKGTYRIDVFYSKYDNHGILKIYVDSTLVLSADQYKAAPETWNNNTNANFTLTTSGLKTIKCLVNTRNGSAVGWYIPMTSLSIVRTA